MDLQMMRRWLALLLLTQLALLLLAAQPVLAVDAGSLAGSVFVDANGNGLAEPDEASVPGAVVSVRAQADGAQLFTATTDAGGLFLLDALPYGLYDVWAGADGKAAKSVAVVEVGEVNAQVLLDLPLYNQGSSAQPEAKPMLYLPLITP